MSAFPYVKRNRTLYRNLLEKEAAKGRELMDQDLREVDIRAFTHKVTNCIKRINEFIGKLDSCNERMSLEAMDDHEQLILSDSSVIEKSLDCCGDLECFQDTLRDMLAPPQTFSPHSLTDDGISQIQAQLQQLSLGQNSNFHSSSIKLPQLDIPTFSGDKMRWKEFWDISEATIDRNPNLNDIEKLNYLNSKLMGEAKGAVSGILLSNENYSVAVALLKERFGDVQSVVNCHYIELININPAVNSSKGLRILYDQVEKHLRSLEALHQDVSQEVFISIITSKLPKHVLVQLEMQKGAKNRWTVNKLRDLLNDYVSAREKAEQHASTGISTHRQQTPHPLRLSTEALISGPKAQYRPHEKSKVFRSCRFCNGNHWNDECMRYPTIEARKQKIRGSCFICLKQGHRTSECTLTKNCFYCGQVNSHHRSLCSQKFGCLRKESAHLVEELFIHEEVGRSKDEMVTSSNKDGIFTSGNTVQEDGGSTENVLISSGETVLMQTAKTDIRIPLTSMTRTVRILLDTGSHRTYITESLAKALNLKMGELTELSLVTFGSKKPQRYRTPTTEVDIALKDGSVCTITANVVPSITGNIQRGPINLSSVQDREHLVKQYALADTLPCERESSTIELLIGSDYYLDLILPQKVEIQPGLYLLASKLGWLLSGRTSQYTDEKQEEMNMLILTHGTNIENETNLYTKADRSLPTKANLEDFWKLETIGIDDSPVDPLDSEVHKSFHDSLQYNDGRYHASWPWKYENPPLPENRELAFGRLKSLITKMKNNRELAKQYDNVIQEQLSIGVIEKVKPGPSDSIKHYISHHAVVNPAKTTTKVRVVYDASAKTKQDNKSLNDCLYRGPVLLQDMTGILLRFRLNKVAIVADIEKAFLQIGLNDNQKDVTRFFWLKNINNLNVDNNIQVYRFCRVPFGIISSPFLPSATIDFHLKMYNSPIADKIARNIYVDNVITGTKSTEEAEKFYRESKQIFAQASMNLRDWTSNDTSVQKEIPVCDRSIGEKANVLGLSWIIKEDVLSLNQITLDPTSEISKRQVLKQIASVYDPLGLFCPVTLQGKLFLQELWNKKLSWDDKLSLEDKEKWNNIKEDLKNLPSCRFPRYIGLTRENQDKTTYRLIGFCDASKHAYAGVVYLYQRIGETCKVDLVFSKLRLAPNKTVSIPRLELLAALIGTRAIQFVANQLPVQLTEKHLWIDSQCVLSWIGSKRHSSRFIENRVAEIRKHKDITFHYVPSKENPADLASRGLCINELLGNNLWWHGPEWLLKPNHVWTEWKQGTQNQNQKNSEVLYEAKLDVVENSQEIPERLTQTIGPFEIDSRRFSSLTKLLRVTSLVGRFIKKLRGNLISTGPIQASEMDKAENLWIAHIQCLHFGSLLESIKRNKPNNLKVQLGVKIDEEGLLRCHGRLGNSDLNETAKYPLLLPKADRFTELLIDSLHKRMYHCCVAPTLAQIRKKYWIPSGRSVVQRVLRRCTVCKRWEGGPYRMPAMPPLPKQRVSESVPFAHCGIDYFGPLYVREKSESKKVWVCLFTCLVTRAIHLELILDMSTEMFLLGLRRFVARHGSPREIISDNASQFKLAHDTIDKLWGQVLTETDVISYSVNEKIRWNFIVELTPWMGGFYERLVGVVKRSLRKAIGKLCLTNNQLLTVLKETEAIINSRPLVYVGDDINSGAPLTPAHFLSLNPNVGLLNFAPEDDYDISFNPKLNAAETLITGWKKGMKHLNKFWQVWRDDYLLNLRERTQIKLKSPRVQTSSTAKVGHIVLIKDTLPRGCWRIGRITELIISRDQQVRSAKVLLPSKKMIDRPLNLLYPIECSETEGGTFEDEQKQKNHW